MKKVTGTITACFIIAILMNSCNEASKKDLGNASQNLKEANNDVKKGITANTDSVTAAAIAQWKNFKNESDSTIAGMERQVTRLKENIASASNKEKEKLRIGLNKTNEKLDALKEKLHQRNAAFENDINKFDATVVSKYQSFESEFKHDMNELGTAFKDLFKDNMK